MCGIQGSSSGKPNMSSLQMFWISCFLPAKLLASFNTRRFFRFMQELKKLDASRYGHDFVQ